MSNLDDLYHQVENEKYICEKYGKEQWVQVLGTKKMNNSDAAFFCGLISLDNLNSVFRDASWDIREESCFPGFQYDAGADSHYMRNCSEDEGKETIVFERRFYELKPSVIEVSEEFRLLNNLYFEKNDSSYYSIKEDGQCEQVVRIEENAVYIKLNYLLRYISAKQKALILYFDINYKIKGSMIENGLMEFDKDIKTDNLFYSIYGRELTSLKPKTFSRLLGKKIILPRPKETCGYWPFEKERKYIEYIIDSDDYGEPISFTSNPSELSDYFGKNEWAPHYLTPVCFKKEVLQKYISDSSTYKVENGILSCGNLWSITLDVDHRDYVMAYLGDLGTYLPECEQEYWKSFNVLTDEKLSKSRLMIDFMNIPSAPDIADVKFKDKYKLLNGKWEKKLGWPLFLPLAVSDQYNLDNIRIPLSTGQEEFDQQVLALNKTLVDSLNEKQIGKEITLVDGMKGIAKLEEWFRVKNLTNYEPHISFLRDLQELRSAGSGHRKGRSYQKICEKLKITNEDRKADFESILSGGLAFLEFLDAVIEKINS